MKKTIFDREPDVEVMFEFIGTRKNPAADAYRPMHLVKDDYLTTGVHHYYNVQTVPPDGTAKGTITFISPEAHPHCLWVGKKINIQEGTKIVGYATVLKVLNPDLLGGGLGFFCLHTKTSAIQHSF
jgi:elongation factor Tu